MHNEKTKAVKPFSLKGCAKYVKIKRVPKKWFIQNTYENPESFKMINSKMANRANYFSGYSNVPNKRSQNFIFSKCKMNSE